MGRWTPTPITKDCSKCGKTHPNTSEFFNVKKGKKTPYLDAMCRACARAKTKAWRAANLERSKANNRAYAQANAERTGAYKKEWNRRMRYEVMIHYGGTPPSCACCGEAEYKFLSIDHINNDGHIQRKLGHSAGGGSGLVRWIKKNNYPPRFQILCHNCNGAKGYYGACPHAEQRDILVGVS